ncbi:MAG: PAS domain-containing protein [Thermoleophilia bacterium]
MFVMDPSGRITDANSVAIQRYGFSLEQFRKMHAQNLTTPERYDSVPRNIADALTGNLSFEWAHRRYDGTTFPVEIKAIPIDIAGEISIFSNMRDISERKLAETALRESEEKFRSLFEESRDAIFISTLTGSFVDINAAGMELLGYNSKTELLGVDINTQLFS